MYRCVLRKRAGRKFLTKYDVLEIRANRRLRLLLITLSRARFAYFDEKRTFILKVWKLGEHLRRGILLVKCLKNLSFITGVSTSVIFQSSIIYMQIRSVHEYKPCSECRRVVPDMIDVFAWCMCICLRYCCRGNLKYSLRVADVHPCYAMSIRSPLFYAPDARLLRFYLAEKCLW